MRNNNFKKWLGVSIITLLVVFIVATTLIQLSCSKKEEVTKIGAILPMTGKMAHLGKSIEAGLRIAESEINKDRKILQVIFEDSKGEAKTGVSIAQKMINIDNVDALITFQDAVCNATVPITRDKGIIQIAMTMNPQISLASNYCFTIFPTSKYEANLIHNFIKNKHPNKISFIYINIPGHLYIVENDLIPSLLEMGFDKKNFLIETIDMLDKDYKEKMFKISHFDPDVLVVFIIPPFLNQFYKDLSNAGLFGKFQIIGNMGFLAQKTVPKELTEGTILTCPSFYVVKKENFSNFLIKCEEILGMYPSIPDAGFSYDALHILSKAFTNSKGNYEKAVGYLSNLENYMGITGKITMEKDRNANVEMSLSIIKNGEFIHYAN